MILDPLYWIIIGIGALLSGGAALLTKSQFNKYSRVMASSRLTGAQAARRMLDHEGLHEVGIERAGGFLSDHYDPRHRVLRLSPAVHDQPSMAAIGVACHEAGHALQHAQAYAPLQMRSALVPLANIGSQFWIVPLMIGFIMGTGALSQNLIVLGICLLGLSTLFTVVTLPVEWDASARARKHMVMAGIVTPAEEPDAGKVLNAAFLTYLAAAITSILTLVYWLLRSGLLGGRND